MSDVACICSSGREVTHRNCPVHAPGITDLMVTPESLDDYLAENLPPEVIVMPDNLTSEISDRFVEEAKAQLEKALSALESNGADLDVFAPIQLAELAARIAWGDTPASEWPENEPDPVCTCPPELVASGGFKGDCPARGYAHA